MVNSEQDIQMVERNGRLFKYRNLDAELVTDLDEKTLLACAGHVGISAVVAERARAVADTFSGVEFRKGGYPYRRTTEELKIMKAVKRQEETVEDYDPILVAEEARRQVAAIISEGYEIPDYAINDSDEIDFVKLPSLFIHTYRTDPEGRLIGKDY